MYRHEDVENPSVLYELAEIQIQYRLVKEKVAYIRCGKQAASILRSIWADDIEYRERFYMLSLNRIGKVLGYYQISSGGVNSTVVDPKLVFGVALRVFSCSGIILAHNHPSGDCLPSESDLRLTRNLQQVGKMLDLRVLDHLILSANYYLSMAENGILKF